MGIFKPNINKMEAKKDIVSLIKCLRNKSWNIRVDAAYALGRIKDPLGAGPLIAALRDENIDVRASVAYALGEIGDSRAVEPLFESLNTENVFAVYEYQVEALGKIKDSRVIELMIDKLKSLQKIIDRYESSKKNVEDHFNSMGISNPLAYQGVDAAMKTEYDAACLFENIARKQLEKLLIILQEITGKDFREDTLKWKMWHEENKIERSKISVTFKVNLPLYTPINEPIYIAGGFNNWEPIGLPLERVNDKCATITKEFFEGEEIEYKYLRGAWERVEKKSDGGERCNRTLNIGVGEESLLVEDVVERWADSS
ncbi:MAG: HEAT repeat domain-containing protein [Nitrospirota bacterium]